MRFKTPLVGSIGRSLAAGILAAPLAACSVGKITGEVDGDLVPAFTSGLVFEASTATDEEDYIAVAAFYTFSNACDLVGQQMDVRADAVTDIVAAEGDEGDIEKAIDAVKDFEAANLPDDYWAAYVILAGDNDNDIEDSFDIEEDPASVVVCHHTGAVDVDRDDFLAAVLPEFAEPFEKDSNRDCFESSEGEVHVSLYEEKKRISLTSDSELKDVDGDDAGEIELGATASYCAATESAVDGLIEELLDVGEEEDNNAAPPSAPPASGGGGSSETCQFTNDGDCDEPEGLNFCAEGTDVNDCANFSAGNDSCQFAFDGECDEPGIGTGACAAGTDASDC